MPNPNYNAGRSFEYRVRKELQSLGFVVLRTAGSHGPIDLIAVKPGEAPVLIQCKRCQTPAEAARLKKHLKESLPLPRSKFYTQWLEIYIAKTRTREGHRLDD